MKKLGISAAICVLSGGLALAGTVRDNCGCGLGSMALGSETGVLSHMAATFLNGISGNQTFGVTSGTLGCDQSTEITSNDEIQRFVSDNLDHLAMDMAMGHGDSLDALADLMQVIQAERVELYTKLQYNFDLIFTSENVSANDVVQHIADVLAKS